MDIDIHLLDRLEREHPDVEAIFGKLEAATDEAEQRALVLDLETALTPQMQTGETQACPAFAEVDEQMAAEVESEHGEARDGLTALEQQIGLPGFREALEPIKSSIERRVEAEEGEALRKPRQSVRAK